MLKMLLQCWALSRAEIATLLQQHPDAPVVIDFVVGHDAQVWPMVAAGASNDDILAARDVRPVFGEGQV